MLGKAYCLLKGHKEVKIKTDTFDKIIVFVAGKSCNKKKVYRR
jgi:hypothetical protein